MTAAQTIDALAEGIAAHKAGLALAHCPYGDREAELRAAWCDGWENREVLIKRRLDEAADARRAGRTHADFTHPED